jgi:hypothetical protein
MSVESISKPPFLFMGMKRSFEPIWKKETFFYSQKNISIRRNNSTSSFLMSLHIRVLFSLSRLRHPTPIQPSNRRSAFSDLFGLLSKYSDGPETEPQKCWTWSFVNRVIATIFHTGRGSSKTPKSKSGARYGRSRAVTTLVPFLVTSGHLSFGSLPTPTPFLVSAS